MKSCDCCGSSAFVPLFVNHDRMYNLREKKYQLIKCKNCGTRQLNDIPDEKEIGDFYPSSYEPLTKKVVNFEENIKLIKISQDVSFFGKVKGLFYHFPFRLRVNRTLPKYKNGSRLLDIGCGSGSFLLLAKRFGFEVYGVEPSAFDDELNTRAGLQIHHGFLKDARFKENYFDVITINHVIEHMQKPSEVFAEIQRIAKPGGTIVIATPNANSLGFWIFGKYWLNTDTPRHIYLFSKQNIVEYAKKAKLKTEKVHYNGIPGSFSESLRYLIEDKLGKPFKWPFYLGKFIGLLILLPMEFVNFIGFGDNMEIILRKEQ